MGALLLLRHARVVFVFYIAEQFFSTLFDGRCGLSKGAASRELRRLHGALVYALTVFGGTVADRVLGYPRRAIIVGGCFMALGEFMLMTPKGLDPRPEDDVLHGPGRADRRQRVFKPNI